MGEANELWVCAVVLEMVVGCEEEGVASWVGLCMVLDSEAAGIGSFARGLAEAGRHTWVEEVRARPPTSSVSAQRS